MKRFLLVFLSLLFCLTCFSSCQRDTEPENGKIKILGTVFPPFDFAREIGGERAEVQMLMPPGADSHSYTGENPSDILKIEECDLFIYVGGETDSGWVERVLERIEKAGGQVPVTVALCDVCELTGENDTGILESESREDEYETDEHVWTSPKNAMRAVEAIRDAMSELDPENSAYYEEHADRYIAELKELDASFREVFEGANKKTLVFADRFPFRYFANEYGLECFAAFNGCASESEPSPTTIVKLCEIVNEKKLSHIFYIETSNSGVPSAISKATGAEALLLHSCHTVSEKELEDGATYLELMKNNLENIKEALSYGK